NVGMRSARTGKNSVSSTLRCSISSAPLRLDRPLGPGFGAQVASLVCMPAKIGQRNEAVVKRSWGCWAFASLLGRKLHRKVSVPPSHGLHNWRGSWPQIDRTAIGRKKIGRGRPKGESGDEPTARWGGVEKGAGGGRRGQDRRGRRGLPARRRVLG